MESCERDWAREGPPLPGAEVVEILWGSSILRMRRYDFLGKSENTCQECRERRDPREEERRCRGQQEECQGLVAVVFCGHENCPTRVRGLVSGDSCPARPQDPRDSQSGLDSATTPSPGKRGKKEAQAHARAAGPGAAAGGVLRIRPVGGRGTVMYRWAGRFGHGAGRSRERRGTGAVVCGYRKGEAGGAGECRGRWY